MNVASKELCEELYKLSGWEQSTAWYESGDLRELVALPISHELVNDDHTITRVCPAYDSGYLLRKLPGHIALTSTNWDDVHTRKIDGQELDYQAVACYQSNIKGLLIQETGDTPENALCKLCIQLWKTGVLK